MLEILSEHRCFNGIQAYYRHDSEAIGLPMRFSVFHPPAERKEMVPVLFYLAGLTCTEETFMIKAGAQRYAAEHGIMLVSCDTSPRGTGIEGADKDWDFGHGAGFYLDATQAPWSRHFRMETYVTQELRRIIIDEFNVEESCMGIFGHSMGGHGALTLALRHPDKFCSVSAFAPIAAPVRAPWGQKAFGNYLGSDQAAWKEHDASELMKHRSTPFPKGILIDQGLGDKFLAEQLLPEEFEQACIEAKQPLTLRRHEGYDHGYYFIASFIEDHLKFHKENLRG
ncbi:S-formylglutathione hydrolase [Noviherbaspirillum sp. CPCC 100848]|uniref:S-formylglutathione hydrolase n=1 Tax=Noviherbaspirillum album TaxID=3080276 RepID=A0ABU6J540_9BURK|nr:S-formylglutathione hydrolase [Noviherbaspirillum sp. CPCC 100848]MEC4718495.1 S-formylglutathione hydrolase [Noviherbaspirillum sp. CPCC 100848]